MNQSESYPYSGEWFLSANKKFAETIVFVPFYEGHKKALKRHIDFVNRLGFDAFAFHLPEGPSLKQLPIASDRRFGMNALISDQIEFFLNELPGQKIVYAFSNPSAAAIDAIARRNCADVKGLICDSGPSGKFINSAYNLIKHQMNEKNVFLRLIKSGLVSVFWSPSFLEEIHQRLEELPHWFPILSIRGWKDKLIPPDHIDAVFDPHPLLKWRKLSLPEAGHLVGLRDFPEDYEPGVKRFLLEIATSHPL